MQLCKHLFIFCFASPITFFPYNTTWSCHLSNLHCHYFSNTKPHNLLVIFPRFLFINSISKPSIPISLFNMEQNLNQHNMLAQHACFTAGCAAVLFSIAKSLLLTATAQAWLGSMLATVAAYFLADLGTGIYHWAIDNYGGPQTPIFGPQIVGFQGHHHRPMEITKMDVVYNVHITAAAVAAVATPINLVCSDPVLLSFIGVFGGFVMFSQQFHAWSHTPKGRLPLVVAALQDAGVILRRAEHAAHHRPPFSTNYCIVSGVWNRALDRSSFFVALEVAVAAVFGHEPRSWSEPRTDWWEKSD